MSAALGGAPHDEVMEVESRSTDSADLGREPAPKERVSVDYPVRDAGPPPKNSMDKLTERKETQGGIGGMAGAFFKKWWTFLAVLASFAVVLAFLGIFAFDPLSWRAWVTFSVLCTALASLVTNVLSTVLTFLLCAVVLMITDVIQPKDALLGFSNQGIASVAVLFMVAEGIQRTSLLGPAFRKLLGSPKKLWIAHIRLLIPCSVVSFFLYTTPTIAIALPIVLRWSKRANFSISKLNMPLNNAVALGGSMTLLGSSTNLVIKGLVEDAKVVDLDGELVILSIFGPTKLAAVQWVAGMTYIIVMAQFLIKDREGGSAAVLKNPRQYTIALKVLQKSPIIGQTVVEAGLRTLEGLFLIEIEREGGEVLPAVSSDTLVHAGDRLLFSGVISTVKELYADVPGVVPATVGTDKLPLPVHNRRLVELVISPSSFLVGQTPRQLKFLSRFHAAIIAVHREGDHINQCIADISLKGGDTLLVETGPEFAKTYAHDMNFALVSEVAGSQPPRTDWVHSAIAGVLVVTMITLVTADILKIFEAASACAVLMIVTRCISLQNAVDSLHVSVIVAVAASFALSNAMDSSGAAAALALFIVNSLKGLGDVGILFGIFLAAGLLTSVLTNNAAGTLLWAIVRRILTQQKSLNPYAAVWVLLLGINSSYATPIAYNTNILLHPSGGYTFMSWVAYGGPLILCMAPVTVLTANWYWPSG